MGAAAPPEIWLSGYSLGGGVGQLLALAAQDFLDGEMGGRVRRAMHVQRRGRAACRARGVQCGRGATAGSAGCLGRSCRRRAALARATVGASPPSPPPAFPTGASPGHLPQAPTVDAVLFAAPNVAGEAFARRYNTRVNARRIEFANDIVAQLPCSATPACPADLQGALALVRRRQAGGAGGLP